MTRHLTSPDHAQWANDRSIPRMSEDEALGDAHLSAQVLAENWAIARTQGGLSLDASIPLDTAALARGATVSLSATPRAATELVRIGLLRPASPDEEREGVRVTVAVTKAGQMVQVVERHPSLTLYNGPHPEAGAPDLTITSLTVDDLRRRPPVVTGDADPRITPAQLLALAAERSAVPVVRTAVLDARATGRALSPTLRVAASVTPVAPSGMPRRVARFLADGPDPRPPTDAPVPSVPLIPKSKSRGVQ
jgi:hypothetical protein